MTDDNLRDKAHHSIDAIWCDLHGVYVTGWAHACDIPILAVYLVSGDYKVETKTFVSRPDISAHFPLLHSDSCGFALYLPCAPFRPVYLGLSTASGIIIFEVTPPPHCIEQPSTNDTSPLDQFVVRMKRMGGKVVEIGARTVSPGSVLLASQFEPECQHIGVDIHPAAGVDIVADAHFLSHSIARGSISGVFSMVVMEHIAAPWLVAAEINKILKIGGLTFHMLPQTFPVHELPNDFWRMSDEALKVLFGSATGFEIVDAGMLEPVQIYYSPQTRYGPFLEMPLHRGMGVSFVLARKVSEIPKGAVAWPMEKKTLNSISRRYPTH